MNTMKTMTAAAIVAATVFAATAFAGDKGPDFIKAEAVKSMLMADADMTNAEVRKVDKDAKKITLKHEAIKSLDMPGMTMVFQVKDSSLIDKVQAGDKVKFKVVNERGAFVVTDLQRAK